MRIQRPQQPAQETPGSRFRERIRSGPGLTRPLLLAILGAALVIVIGVWFRLEGYQALFPLLRGLRVQAVAEPESLPSLRLDIGDRQYQVLAERRELALRGEGLSPDATDWVDARLEFEGKWIPAQVRLTGDSSAHWRQDKWSLQGRTQGDANLMGMQLFSLQSPATQSFLDGWLYTRALRRVGILASRLEFVNLSVNGADWGAYALVEEASEAMLGAQGRQGGIIAGFEDTVSRHAPNLVDDGWGVDADPVVIDSGNDLDAGEQADMALRLLRAFQRQQLVASEVFDAQAMGKYLAHANLWGACDGLAWRDQRFYYDPATLWLEPIAPDPCPLAQERASRIDLVHYDDPIIMEAYAQEVLRISRPEYLEGLQAAFGEELDRLRAALLREFDPVDLTPPWQALAERQATMAAALHPPRPVHAYGGSGFGVMADLDSTVDLRVANLAPYPVVVRQVQAGKRSVDVLFEWLPPSDAGVLHEQAKPAVVLRSADWNQPRYVTIRIPSSVAQSLLASGTTAISSTLQVVANVVGVDDPVAVPVLEDAPPAAEAPLFPRQPTLEEALQRYPFLELAGQPGFLELKPGIWQVEGDLVLPDGLGLLATQPATLEFARSAVLFSTGPLVLRGPDAGSIRLIPTEDSWAGVYVLQRDREGTSELYNVEIAGTAGVQRAGWSLPAGATFQDGSVTIERCGLQGSVAEAALHVVDTSFELVATEFGDISGDAFDADSAQGSIRQVTFHDILGTAIDLRGSDVVMEDVTLLRSLGRGISASQESMVTADGIHVENSSIAVASSDGSRVEVLDIRLSQVWTAAFAAYRTGPAQGPASIGADGVVFEDDLSQVTRVQEDCRVTINGVDAIPSELDPGTIYRRVVARSAARAANYGFGPVIRLAGYDLSRDLLVAGDALRLVLYWQALEELDRDYTVFVHVLDRSGRTVAQRDSMPRDNSLPTTLWHPGDVVEDTHLIPLPRDLPPGEYKLALGIYYWETMERLPLRGPDGESLQEGVLILDRVIRVGD